MAQLTISGLDNVLKEMVLPLTKAIESHDGDDALKLLGSFEENRIRGKGLEAYIPIRTLNDVAGALMTEGGEFAAPITGDDEKGKLGVSRLGFTLGFTQKVLDGLSSGDGLILLGLQDRFEELTEYTKNVQRATFWGRGDGVVARCDGDHTGAAVTEFTSSIAVTAVEGDELVGYKQSAFDGDERSMAAADTDGSTYIYDVAPRVVDVDLENKKIYLSAAVKITDEAVIVRKSTTSTNKTWPDGILTGADDDSYATGWDADDASTYLRPTTYLNLTRSSVRKANAKWISKSGKDLDLEIIMQICGMARENGCRKGDMVVIMSEKQLRRFLNTYAGQMVIKDMEMNLPGGNSKLPTWDGNAAGQVGFITSRRWPDKAVMATDKTIYKRLSRKGEWQKIGGQRVLPLPGTSNWTLSHVANWHMPYNIGCVRPYRQIVAQDLNIPS